MPLRKVSPLAISALLKTPALFVNTSIGHCIEVGVCAASVPELSTVAVKELSHAKIIIVTGPVGCITVTPTTGAVAEYPARIASEDDENVSVVPLRAIVPANDVTAAGPLAMLGDA